MSLDEQQKEKKEYDIDDYYKSFIKLKDISNYLSSELQNSINIQEDLLKETISNEIVGELNERRIDSYTFIDEKKVERVMGFSELYMLSLFSIDLVYLAYKQLLNQIEG